MRERARRTVDQRLLLHMPRLAAASFPLIAALPPTAALVEEARLSPRSINSAFAVLREWIPHVLVLHAIFPPTRAATGGSPSNPVVGVERQPVRRSADFRVPRPSTWPPWCARAPRGRTTRCRSANAELEARRIQDEQDATISRRR